MSGEIFPVKLPKWGLEMEEGRIVNWQVREGDAIHTGDELLEIETSKIINTVESQATGILRRIVAQAGDTLPVGQLLGVIAAAQIPDTAIEQFITGFQANTAAVTAARPKDSNGPKTLVVAGRRINYIEVGPANGHIPVILIHGFGGDYKNWLFNLDALSQARRVYVLDLPGHGGSDKAVGDGSIKMFADWLLGWMEALEIPAAHLIAHSMGAALALQAALDHPVKIKSLGLIAPCGLSNSVNGSFLNGFLAAQNRRELKPVMEWLVADKTLITRDMVEDVLHYKRLDGVTAALEQIAGELFPGGRQAAQYQDRLPELNIPIVVITGKSDEIIAPIPRHTLPDPVTIHELEQTGHMPHMEAAARVNAILKEHLEGR